MSAPRVPTDSVMSMLSSNWKKEGNIQNKQPHIWQRRYQQHSWLHQVYQHKKHGQIQCCVAHTFDNTTLDKRRFNHVASFSAFLPRLTSGTSMAGVFNSALAVIKISLENSSNKNHDYKKSQPPPPPPPPLHIHTIFIWTWSKWDLWAYVIVHTTLPPSPVILWIELGGKPKWLPLKVGHHEVMCTASILEWPYSLLSPLQNVHFYWTHHWWARKAGKDSKISYQQHADHYLKYAQCKVEPRLSRIPPRPK